jgi:hypothetical protein
LLNDGVCGSKTGFPTDGKKLANQAMQQTRDSVLRY